MSELSERLRSLSPAKRKLLQERLRQAQPAAEDRRIPRRKDDGPCPASFAQQRFWFLHQYEPDVPAYNMPKILHLRGALNVPVLERALAAVVERHETLRTVIRPGEREPLQVILRDWSLPLPRVDLRHVPAEERAQRLNELLSVEINRRFDLDRDLSMRCALFELGAQEFVLLIVTHHIATDHWSSNLLLRELGQFYEAFERGEPSPLAELPVTYADYAVWEHRRQEQGGFDEHLAYWRSELETRARRAQLLTDRPRPAVQTYAGKRHPVFYSAELTGALTSLARQHRTTQFVTVLAALQVLMYRYSGTAEVVIGFPVASRGRVELEHLIGNLINTLAVRVDLSDDPGFDRLLERVRSKTLEAYDHRELPFAMLVEELQPERDLSRSPVFDVMLDFANVPEQGVRMAGLEVERREFHRDTSLLDLSLYLRETNGRLKGAFEYNTDLFEAETIERLAEHFETLLQAVVTDPTRPVSRLPLMSPAESQRVTVEWNDTERVWPGGLVHELIAARARAAPAAVAVECRGRQLSYEQLLTRSAGLASYLRTRCGVRPGVLVGVHMERSLEMLVALLATLRAGGAYVPLDPAYPVERRRFLIRDAGLQTVLTSAGLDCPAEPPARVFEVDEALPADTASPLADFSETPGPKDPVYVIYTSGSTGRPKGVVVPHGALTNLLHAMRERTGMTSRDTWLAVTTLSFDIAALELWLPLCVGARVVIAGGDEAADPAALAGLVERHSPTVMQMTPTAWRLLVEAGWSGKSSLQILCGGEPLDPSLARRLVELGGSALNLYGPTETTVWSSCAALDGAARRVTIGRPLANTRFYILDPTGRPTPIGVPGELYIGGAGLAGGYVNREDLTRERFVSGPFGGDSNERLYRTGDAARWLANGEVEYLGRLDDQIKLRGFRIELGEVESVLQQHPEVRHAAVAVDTTGGAERLAAFVVSAGTVGVAELRRHLQAQLPAYMIPSSFVAVEELPRLPNGKLDRRALLAQGGETLEGESTGRDPRGGVETAIATLWQELLGRDRVAADDNFFELGGHSLLAIRMMNRMRTVMAVDLPLRSFFEAPTVAELAAVVEGMETHVF